jgi:hypothetical protein
MNQRKNKMENKKENLTIKSRAFINWVINNVDERVIPADEGDGEGLVYNLIHLFKDGENYKHYNYEEEQNDEIEMWYKIFSKK